MQIWTDRYLILLGVVGIILSVSFGYQYAFIVTIPQRPLQMCSSPSSFAMTALRDTQLPSVIPNFRLAARRHLFLPVDLRRADLQLEIQPDSTVLLKPVLDKVLFVPKKFG